MKTKSDLFDFRVETSVFSWKMAVCLFILRVGVCWVSSVLLRQFDKSRICCHQ